MVQWEGGKSGSARRPKAETRRRFHLFATGAPACCRLRLFGSCKPATCRRSGRAAFRQGLVKSRAAGYLETAKEEMNKAAGRTSNLRLRSYGESTPARRLRDRKRHMNLQQTIYKVYIEHIQTILADTVYTPCVCRVPPMCPGSLPGAIEAHAGKLHRPRCLPWCGRLAEASAVAQAWTVRRTVPSIACLTRGPA